MALVNQVRCSNCGAVVRPADASAGVCDRCGTAVPVNVPPSSRGFAPARASTSALPALALLGLLSALFMGAGVVVWTTTARPRPPIEAHEPLPETPPAEEPATTTAATSAPEPSEPLKRVLTFGEKGQDPGLFDDPRELAVDVDGSIYVADYQTGRIQKFDAAGAYVALFEVEPLRDTNLILGLAVANGQIYVSRSHQIVRLSLDGGETLGTLSPGLKAQFRELAVDQAGNLYALLVTDDLQHGEIVKFDKSATVVGRWPRQVREETWLIHDRLAVGPSGTMFVLHAQGCFVEVLDEQGAFSNRIGQKGTGPGEFDRLVMPSIAVDGSGHVFVAHNGEIDAFDAGGSYRGALGLKAENVNVRSMVVGPDGRIYITTPESVVVFEVDAKAVAAPGE